MIYPLVRELAAKPAPFRVSVAVTCRVLGFSKQAYYRWRAKPCRRP
jgi:putative transposase